MPKVSGQDSLLEGELHLCCDLMSTGNRERCSGSITDEEAKGATEVEGHSAQDMAMSVGVAAEEGEVSMTPERGGDMDDEGVV